MTGAIQAKLQIAGVSLQESAPWWTDRPIFTAWPQATSRGAEMDRFAKPLLLVTLLNPITPFRPAARQPPNVSQCFSMFSGPAGRQPIITLSQCLTARSAPPPITLSQCFTVRPSTSSYRCSQCFITSRRPAPYHCFSMFYCRNGPKLGVLLGAGLRHLSIFLNVCLGRQYRPNTVFLSSPWHVGAPTLASD